MYLVYRHIDCVSEINGMKLIFHVFECNQNICEHNNTHVCIIVIHNKSCRACQLHVKCKALSQYTLHPQNM